MTTKIAAKEEAKNAENLLEFCGEWVPKVAVKFYDKGHEALINDPMFAKTLEAWKAAKVESAKHMKAILVFRDEDSKELYEYSQAKEMAYKELLYDFLSAK